MMKDLSFNGLLIGLVAGHRVVHNADRGVNSSLLRERLIIDHGYDPASWPVVCMDCVSHPYHRRWPVTHGLASCALGFATPISVLVIALRASAWPPPPGGD